jgi:outer membrane protein with beta-barrel domain
VTGARTEAAGRRRAGRWIVLAGILLVFGRAASARAEIGAQDVEIGVDYGLQRFDPGLLGETGGRWSVRGGRHETDLLQWEGQVSRGRVETTPLPGAERSVTLSQALVNLVINFHPRAEVVPYVLLGLGLAKTEIEAVGLSSSDTATGYQFGGGGRFFFGKGSAVALRVELLIVGADAFEHSYFHPSIGAGLTFRIGHHRAPGVAPAKTF